ncbi:hypothetical protein JL475_02785 [Streptomyces sp. M2CJ-2]|uniref:hypothetical protein n=1 Tax=Streptomyces sp. M2CJ-2 TaxID=2803948 RepID=UPI0019231B3E|nr:hypothetical protein [Streptomyces sp. M2CJ-2]MBL3664960.1 hypothetical protein [Streptomyces sp. M2CJ-2]
MMQDPELKAEFWDVCTALFKAVIRGLPTDAARTIFRERFTDIGGRAGMPPEEIDHMCHLFKLWLQRCMDEYAKKYPEENVKTSETA